MDDSKDTTKEWQELYQEDVHEQLELFPEPVAKEKDIKVLDEDDGYHD